MAVTEPITTPASDVVAALDFLKSRLEGVQIRAEADPRDLNPPCAWITADTLAAATVLCGDSDVACSVFLICPDNGLPHTLVALNEMLRQALTVISPTGEIDLRQSVALPGGGDPAPAFRIPVTVTVTQPQE